MLKPTKHNVEALAKQYSATLDYYPELAHGQGSDYNYDLPAGKVWVATGSHCAHTIHYPGQEPIANAWQDLIEQMGRGVEPCEDCAKGECDALLD